MGVESEAGSSVPGSPVADLPNLASTSRPPLFRVKWDNPERRGPPSVAETVESRADLPYTQPPLDQKFEVWNNSSTSLALGALPSTWSCSKYGLNAISTVLNNPHRKQDPPKAHYPVPTYKTAVLPRVRRKDFEPYLNAIRPEWDRIQRNLLLRQESTTQLNSNFPAEHPRPARAGKQLPSLDSIPSVFFDPSFDLGKPDIFAAVTEQKPGESSVDPAALSHSLPLLERMSHYADTIEQHLVREISQRSTSFFAALTNLQDLQTESEQCLDRISQLRATLKEVDEKGAKRGLEIVRLQKRLENLRRTQEGVKFVESASEMTNVTRSLVEAGEWGEALTVIDSLNHAMKPDATESNPSQQNGHTGLEIISEEDRQDNVTPISLSRMTAFNSLPMQLQALSLQISAALIQDVVSAFRVNLQSRWNNSSNFDNASEEANRVFRVRLVPLLQGLVRTNGLKSGMNALRNVVVEEVKACTKMHLSQSGNDDILEEDLELRSPQEKSAALVSFLQGKSHDDFIQMAASMYTTLLRCLEGVKSQNATMLEILHTELSSVEYSEDIASVETTLTEVLVDGAELANSRASKVLTIRSGQHESLELSAFTMLFNASWNFLVACEVMCQKMIVGLRGTAISQAKAFMSSFHSKRLSQSAKFVEDEQWAPVDVAHQYQQICEVILESAVRDPDTLKLRLDLSTPVPVVNGDSQSSTVPAKALRIEDKTFFVVGATLRVLELSVDYLRVIMNLSILTTDAMSRCIEFLKAFNSRTCQVVLGAGAMRSAGLKNITAKHLALASQSLSVFVALIPYIRETFRRHLSATQAVMLIEFDKLKRDYQEHQNEIHDKLIAIMNDRLNFHCKSLSKIDWTVSVSKPKVNEYMEQLVKEATTLHKVLSKYLPEQPVEYIMTQVFAAINHRLEEEYGHIELPDESAKERLLVDARFLRAKTSTLKGIGAMSMLEVVVNEKRPKTVTNTNATSPANAPAPPPSPISVSPPQPPLSSPAVPPSSVPAQINPTPSLPSTIRRSPFAGNKRISSLLSSVSAIGKGDKAISNNAVTSSPPPPPEKLNSPEKMLPIPTEKLGLTTSSQTVTPISESPEELPESQLPPQTHSSSTPSATVGESSDKPGIPIQAQDGAAENSAEKKIPTVTNGDAKSAATAAAGEEEDLPGHGDDVTGNIERAVTHSGSDELLEPPLAMKIDGGTTSDGVSNAMTTTTAPPPVKESSQTPVGDIEG